MTNYTVYRITKPNGTIYIGRTSDMERRFTLHAYYSQGDQIDILVTTPHFYKSMGLEIAMIKQHRDKGIQLLNKTRGGFYDCYDMGKSKRNRQPKQPP